MTAASPKVLVIDDEPPIRKLLRMGLSTQGYDILEAGNAKASLQLLEQKPDLVILDLGLPDMQGLDLLRMIRARDEKVILVPIRRGFLPWSAIPSVDHGSRASAMVDRGGAVS